MLLATREKYRIVGKCWTFGEKSYLSPFHRCSPLIHREDDLLHEILDCENISRESSLLRFLINKNNYQIKFLYIETYVFRKISTYITQKKINISINISFEDSKRNVTFSPFT